LKHDAEKIRKKLSGYQVNAINDKRQQQINAFATSTQ